MSEENINQNTFEETCSQIEGTEEVEGTEIEEEEGSNTQNNEETDNSSNSPGLIIYAMPIRDSTPSRFVRFLRRVVRGITRRIISPTHDLENNDYESGIQGLPPGVPLRLVFLIVDDDSNVNFENLDDFYFQEILNHLHNAFEPQGIPPASEKIIDNLKDVIIESPENAGKCTICLESWHQGETVTKLSCEHSFCKDCIVQWLKMHNSCPLCRSSMKEESTVVN